MRGTLILFRALSFSITVDLFVFGIISLSVSNFIIPSIAHILEAVNEKMSKKDKNKSLISIDNASNILYNVFDSADSGIAR